jgi:cell volume regulation protein A
MAAYAVEPQTLVVDRDLDRLPLPPGTRIVSVVRDDVIRAPDEIGKLAAGDRAIVLSDPAQLPALDALFAARALSRARPATESLFGEFTFAGDVTLGAIAHLYGLETADEDRATPVGAFLEGRLRGRGVVGDRLAFGGVELVVRDMADKRITKVGIELEPESWWQRHVHPLRAWLGNRFKRRPPATPAKASRALADRSTPAAPDSQPTSGS